MPFKSDEFLSSSSTSSSLVKSPKRMKNRFEECRHVLADCEHVFGSEVDPNEMLPVSVSVKEFSSVDKCSNKHIVDVDDINKNLLMVTYMIKLSSIVSNQGTIS